MHDPNGIYGSYFGLLSPIDCRLLYCHLRCLSSVHQPCRQGQEIGVGLSHVLYCLCSHHAAFATGLYYAGIGMGYLYLLMGVIISSAVFPGAMTLVWKQQNWIAAACSPVLGLAVSLIAWLVTAKKEYGELTVASTGAK